MLLASLLPSIAWFTVSVLAILLEIKLIAIERRQKVRLRQVHTFVIMFIVACLYGSFRTLETRNWESLDATAESIWKGRPAKIPIIGEMAPRKGEWIFYYVGKDMSLLKKVEDLPKRPRDTMRLVDSSPDVSTKNLGTIVYFDLALSKTKSYIVPKETELVTLTSYDLDVTIYDAKAARWLGSRKFAAPPLPPTLHAREINSSKTPSIDEVRKWAINDPE